MTIAYSIDSGAEIHGVISDWQRQPLRGNTDGTIDFSDWAIHTWNIPVNGLTNFETLRALQGQALTTLESNDIDAINSAKIYGSAFIEGVVEGNHQALQMLGVIVTFRVDITS